MSRPSAEHLWERLGETKHNARNREVTLVGASRWGTCAHCHGKTFEGTGFGNVLMRACASCGHVEPVKRIP